MNIYFGTGKPVCVIILEQMHLNHEPTIYPTQIFKLFKLYKVEPIIAKTEEKVTHSSDAHCSLSVKFGKNLTEGIYVSRIVI